MRILLLLLFTLTGSSSWAQIDQPDPHPTCPVLITGEASTLIAHPDHIEERSQVIYEDLLKRFSAFDPRKYSPRLISEPGQQTLRLYAKILAHIAHRADVLDRTEPPRLASTPCTRKLVRSALMRNPEALLMPWCENIVPTLVRAAGKYPQVVTELEHLVPIAARLEAAEIGPFMNRIVDLIRGAFTPEEILENRLKRLIVENKQIVSNRDFMIPSLAYQLKTDFGQSLIWADPSNDDEMFSFYRRFPSGFIQIYKTSSLSSLMRHLRHVEVAVLDIPMPIVSKYSRKARGFVWSRVRVARLSGGSLPALHAFDFKLLDQKIIPRFASANLQKQAFENVSKPIAPKDFIVE